MFWFFIKLLLYLIEIIVVALVCMKVYVEFVKGICRCTARIDGKLVLITGGNTGIGFETAKRLARHGARVIIASRNLEKSKAAAQLITKTTGNPNIEAKSIDLASLSSVKAFADDFNRSYHRLDILINNAGYCQLEQASSDDGIEMIMQVNHVGPAYLTHLLLDKLIASKPSRIIFVSSGLYQVHRFDPDDLTGKARCNMWTRYGNSKLCNILSAKALALRLPEGVTANALHPGATDSEIWERIPWELPRRLAYFILRLVCRSVEECAQTSSHAALAPSLEYVSGQFLEECELTTLKKVPPPAEFQQLAQRVWDETIKLAQGIVEIGK